MSKFKKKFFNLKTWNKNKMKLKKQSAIKIWNQFDNFWTSKNQKHELSCIQLLYRLTPVKDRSNQSWML